jgi:3-deoxy-D-manno-octulosonic-acid transferase
VLIYNLFLVLYRFGVWVTSLYNAKAKQWLAGRKDWRLHMGTSLSHNEKRIWLHCSSLGEFEQGKPLIEALKAQYPAYKIVLTFFSPSGYEECKDYKLADHIFYLPMDGKSAAKDFVAVVKPAMAVFVKYEFWHYYLNELKRKKVPTLLVAAAFRPEQPFFKWYGGFFRKMLRCFTQIHVQDGISAKLLQAIGFSDNVYTTGDTRYDRVTAISTSIRPIPEAEKFKGDNKILIAGSTWPDDETLLKQCISSLPTDWKVIIAPHEVHSGHIDQVLKLLGSDVALFSELAINTEAYRKRILIIDNIGMLSSLYAYGDIAYVGGGFLKGGIHNTLEPAAFGLPVVMGPVYQKFVEAVSLVKANAAFPVNNATEAEAIIVKLVADDTLRQSIRDILQKFMRKKTGAAGRITAEISKAGLLQ